MAAVDLTERVTLLSADAFWSLSAIPASEDLRVAGRGGSNS
jgi:hypothetical protein